MAGYRQRGRLRGNAGSGGGPGGGPDCGFPAPTNPLSDPNCSQIGSRYCFTQLGATLALAAVGAAGATAIALLTPVNLIEFTPRAFTLAVFDPATNGQIQFGTVDRVDIYGDDQLAGGAVAWSRFDPQMPFLEVNWRPATPQNPIRITLTNLSTVPVTALLTVDGDGLKG